MLQKTNILMMVIVALVVYIVTRELTLSQMSAPTNAAYETKAPREKKSGGDGPDPYEKEQVKNTLTKSAKDFQECYLAYLKDEPKNKSVSTKIDWQIYGDGSAVEVGVIYTEAESLSACLVDKLKSVRFPPPPEGRPYYVAHNFQFKTTEQVEKEKKEREEMEKKYKPMTK